MLERLETAAVSNENDATSPSATSPDPTSPDHGLRFSFVIANYNYERFVARAIESALAVDWPEVEIIVVDDGSVDGSRATIEAFGDQITAIFQKNGGQRTANNAGFARSTGDIITFLDADDVVEAEFAAKIAAVWHSGVSKAQVLMELVDEHEKPIGKLIPDIETAPSPDQIRSWIMASNEYPTPPGSGNAYSRQFLDTIFPVGEEHDSFTDSTCLAMAPLLGDVVTVMHPLVLYRRHGANDSDVTLSPDRFGREVARALKRQASTEQLCALLNIKAPDRASLRRNRHLLQLRACSFRAQRENHPMAQDSFATLFRDAVASIFQPGFDKFTKRALVAAWVIAVLVVPKPLFPGLAKARFGSS